MLIYIRPTVYLFIQSFFASLKFVLHVYQPPKIETCDIRTKVNIFQKD